MKRLALSLALAATGVAYAQIPDVLVKIDGLVHYQSEKHGSTTLRFYDSLGNYGTVGLSFTLEPGFSVLISQRLQKIRGNADDDQLDQLFIEDRGYWKLGKQLMPFGQNGLLRESTYGARLETTLGIEALPASLAACDGGRGLQRGFIGRIGSRLGLSFALGERFGIDASSFTVVRRPEDSPGRNRGYKQILGVDYSKSLGRVKVKAEQAWLRVGQTDEDPDREVLDVSFSLEPEPQKSVTFGWSKDSEQSGDFFRLMGKWPAGESAWIEPIVQLRNGSFRSAGVSLRVKF